MVLVTGGLAVHDTLKVPYDLQFHPMAGILGSLAPQLFLAPLAYWISRRMFRWRKKKQQEARAQQAGQQAREREKEQREKEQREKEQARRQQEKQEEARRHQ